MDRVIRACAGAADQPAATPRLADAGPRLGRELLGSDMVGAAAQAEEAGFGHDGGRQPGELAVTLEPRAEVLAALHERGRVGDDEAVARLGGGRRVEEGESLGALEADPVGAALPGSTRGG